MSTKKLQLILSQLSDETEQLVTDIEIAADKADNIAYEAQKAIQELED